MTTLKPCPFCGGKAEHFGGGGQHSVRCKQCGITNERIRKGEAMYEAYDTSEGAIAAWNRRVEQGSETLVRCGECIKPLTECPFKEYVMLKTDYCSHGVNKENANA